MAKLSQLYIAHRRRGRAGPAVFLWRNHLLKASLAKQREHEREISEQLAHIEALMADLRKANEVAVRASEAKSTFLSHMSHEIRTPLAAD